MWEFWFISWSMFVAFISHNKHYFVWESWVHQYLGISYTMTNEKSFFLNVSDVCYPYSLLVSYPFLHQTCMVQVHLISHAFMRSTILFIVHLLHQHLMNHAVNQCLKHRCANGNKHVLWQGSPNYAKYTCCTSISWTMQ